MIMPVLVVVLLGGCSQFSIYSQFRSITSPTSTVGLQITPTTAGLLVGGTEFFTASGGVSPYTFSVLSGGAGGSINSSTGAYTAPSTAGTDTIQVTDANGNIANAKVTDVAVAPLTISPAAIVLNPGNSYTFQASGGVPPYTYTLISGSVGTLSGAVYTFPSTATSSSKASVTVTDSIGITAAPASITAASTTFAVSPSSATASEGGSFTFIAGGGTSPYSIQSVAPGTGTTEAVSGQAIYVAAATAGSYKITVKDSSGGGMGTPVSLAVLPAPPSSLAATTVTGGIADLTWNNNSANITSLVVQRAVGTGTYSTIATFTTTPWPTSYQDTGLSSGTVYAYRVVAVFTGTSTVQSYSNEAVIVAQ